MSYREITYREPFNWLNKGHFYKYNKHYFFVKPNYSINILYDTAYAPHPFKPVLYDEITYNWTKEFLDKIYNEDYDGIEDLGEVLVLTSYGILSNKDKFDAVGTMKIIIYDEKHDTFNKRTLYKKDGVQYDNVIEWLNREEGDDNGNT